MAKLLRTARRYWKLIVVSCFSLSIAIALGVLALSVSNTALLLPPSGAEPDRLAMIYAHSAHEDIGKVSYPDYEYFRKNNHVFTDIAAAPNSIGLNVDFEDDGREVSWPLGRCPRITSRSWGSSRFWADSLRRATRRRTRTRR
jgi:hypothetical protein